MAIEARCKQVIDQIKTMGASYGDIRLHVRDEEEHYSTLSGVLQGQDYQSKTGYGIRVLYNGAWGFASSENINDIDAVARKAVENAKTASALTNYKVDLAPKKIYKDLYATPVNTDPFSVETGEKIKHLLSVDSKIKNDKLMYWGIGASFYRKEVLYFDTEGAEIQKKLLDIDASLFALALDKEGEQQRRSYNMPYHAYGTIGWDNLTSVEDYTGHAARITEELLQVCQAPRCEKEKTMVIILPDQMALQTHETIGHALELDRILGYELSYAGGSFVDLADFGKLRYGSEKLTARADATLPNSPGSFGYDDDGVKAANNVLIEKGILKNAITARQMVTEANKKAGRTIFAESGGTNRATSYNRTPIERMTNINIDPGTDGSLNDIIAKCEDGLLLDVPVSWSIGSNRENFHFACEIGWKIKDGKISHVVKNPSYRGNTVEFWNSLAYVGNKDTWQLQVVFNCGKGQPNQVMRLGHGIPICAFSNVQVGC